MYGEELDMASEEGAVQEGTSELVQTQKVTDRFQLLGVNPNSIKLKIDDAQDLESPVSVLRYFYL